MEDWTGRSSHLGTPSVSSGNNGEDLEFVAHLVTKGESCINAQCLRKGDMHESFRPKLAGYRNAQAGEN